MAFMGHPVLADIRKGMRLRPTQTVDKSKPIIQAEGECVKIERCEPKPAAVPPPPPMAQQQKQQTAVRKPPPQNGAPPPPPAMQQQNGNRSGSRQPVGEDARQKLLAQIRTGGVRLRHVQTNDKSGLILDEEQQRDALRLRQNGTPHSLDSQGKSPSPSLAPSSAASALSPSPPVVWPAHSSLCSRDSSSDSSSAFQCPSPSPPPPTVFVHQKRERQPQPEADFQFDEQKLIADRREEVAALAHKGSASAKIAAFQKLQQQASSAASLSYCTLPRRMAHQGQQQQNGAKALAGRAVPAKAAQSNSPASFTQQQQQQQQRQRRSPIPAAHGSAGAWTQQRRSPSPVDHFRAPQRHQRAVDNVANGQNGSCADRTLGRANSIGHGNSANVRLTSPHPMEPSPPARAPTPQGERLVLNTVWSSGNGEGVRQKGVVSRRSPSPVPLHRSSSSSMAFPPPSSPAPFFRPFAQRVPIGGTQSRQHFERIRGRFDRAPSGEATWKRAAQQRKRQQTAQSNDCSVLPPPPPLPACSPPQLRSTSIFVGGGHQHPRDEGEQFAALRTGFAFAIDLDGDAEGKRLIRIVRR